MKKRYSFTVFFVFLTFFSLFVSFLTAKESPLLSQQALEPYGLTRVWFNQAEINSSRSKVLHTVVEGGTMFVVSDDAKLHVIDAETGKLLWMRTLGNREMIFQEPAVNSRMVAVLNGVSLFIFDRRNGKLLLQTPLPGASSTACEMSENYVYIPMLGGKIVAFPLLDVSGPKLEDENVIAGLVPEEELSAEKGAVVESTEETDNPPANGEDPMLANIIRQFAEVKQSILAEPEPPKKEPEIFLKDAIGIPMVSQSFGNVLIKPMISAQILRYNQRHRVTSHRETLTWVTDRGFLFAAGIQSLSREIFELQYMVDSSSQTYYLGSDRIARKEWEKNKELAVRPTLNQCIPPLYTENKVFNPEESPNGWVIQSLIVVGGKTGYVFAVKDRTGEVAWQFAASGPILEQIAVIGTDIYCPTSTGGMHALDLLTGQEKWYTPGIRQFITASRNRLYTLDGRKRLIILDRSTGNPINSLDCRQLDHFFFNIETDRIYAVNETGLIQCLQERQPQKTEDILQNKPIPPLQHRLNCKQYVDVLNGKPAPIFYWQNDENGEGAEGTEVSNEPEKSSKKESGEDGSLDGNERDDETPKLKAPVEKKEEKKEADPFSSLNPIRR